MLLFLFKDGEDNRLDVQYINVATNFERDVFSLFRWIQYTYGKNSNRIIVVSPGAGYDFVCTKICAPRKTCLIWQMLTCKIRVCWLELSKNVTHFLRMQLCKQISKIHYFHQDFQVVKLYIFESWKSAYFEYFDKNHNFKSVPDHSPESFSLNDGSPEYWFPRKP